MNLTNTPKLEKPYKIIGRSLIFRNANEKDASFILELRTDSEKSKFLSKTDNDLQKQTTWLNSYAKKNDQVYFIIENLSGESIGTIRIYDLKQDSFCWGSWILKKDAPKTAAIESALMIYSFAIGSLGFKSAHFDVRKGNKNVWLFHERFGARRTKETELDYFYEINLNSIENSLKKYNKYLPDPIKLVTEFKHEY
jgi:hypothetical protein